MCNQNNSTEIIVLQQSISIIYNYHTYVIIVDAMVAEDFVPHLLDVVRGGEGEGEVREMAALALSAAVRRSGAAMKQCIGDLHLKGVLERRVQEGSTAEVGVGWAGRGAVGWQGERSRERERGAEGVTAFK